MVIVGKKDDTELSSVNRVHITKINQTLTKVKLNSNNFQRKYIKNSIKAELFRFAQKLSQI